MKSNDNQALFEVFKPGVRDDLTFAQKLRYWFVEVYWYHFRTITLLALFGIIMLVILIGDIIHRPNDDLGYIVAGDAFVTLEQERGIEEFVKSVIDDANGDGEITVKQQTLCLGINDGESSQLQKDAAEPYDEFTQANQNKLAISFADNQFILYIMDQKHMDPYIADGAMEPLKTFGIQGDEWYCVYVGESKLFKELGIPQEEDNKWYAAVKIITQERSSEKMQAKYEQAAKVLKALSE